MKKSCLSRITGLFVGVIGVVSVEAAVTVQDPGNVVGTGDKAWSYLVVEGESYASEVDATAGVGFTRVDDSGAITSFLGNPILARNTTASQKGALWMQNATKHGDKVTYQMQFAKAGTYYLYLRFSMFESGVGETHYLNEDSFFLPPDFDKDPQTDWPLMDAGGQNGGYTEGCCDGAGFLSIPEKGGGGVRINHSSGVDADGNRTDFWEGNFHWNDLLSSQFLNVETQGEPSVRRKYEVTADKVGKPLNFTISNRESGMAVDLWLFSTNPDLMDQYTQEELDQLLLKPASTVTVQDPGNVVGTGDKAWSYLVVEGESYASEIDAAAGVGFTRVDNSGAITSFLSNPILAQNTTASQKGALWMQNATKHGDKVTYQMQFAKAGTYYLYLRFSMFESGVGETHYLNEDSFFLPPDFDKDPQTDWPLMDAGGQNGGYTEGCCDGAGFLSIPEKGGGGVRINHSSGVDADGNRTDFWEGNFHWNDLLSSQFLNIETQGEPSVRRKYEVTADKVGKPLNFTISNRESGMAVDLWLFSTNPDLMDQYTQEELDQLLLTAPPAAGPNLAVSLVGKNAVLSWPSSLVGFVLESSTTLLPPNWTLDTTPVVVVGNQNSVTVDASSGTKFYRLRKP